MLFRSARPIHIIEHILGTLQAQSHISCTLETTIRYTSTYPIKLLWEYRVRLIILSSKNRGVDLRETQVMQMNHDITIQDVFHRFLPQYCETHNFSLQQQLTALCISKCHTLEMGANLSECESCHKKYIHYNSCKNRHCPMCQGMEIDESIDKQ